jgi:UDPglucose 6-dehydrogenase
MDPIPSSVVGSEEGALVDIAPSTAPTTPEGSLTFSPVLRATADGHLDIDSASLTAQAKGSESLASILPNLRPRLVRNICCVGAGYVGRFCHFTSCRLC